MNRSSLIQEVRTPALVVDLDIFDQNVSAAERMVQGTGKFLRPHVKTHRTAELARRQLGDVAMGVTCATVGEAETMMAAGISDILLANEVITSDKINRLVALARVGQVTVAVDAREQVRALSSAAAREGRRLRILVDLDVGLGRCGVQNVDGAIELATLVAQSPGLHLAGVMGYEGRLRASAPDRSARLARTFGMLAQARERLDSAGLKVEVISGAGTSTLPEALQDPAITEIQAGSYALMEPDLEPLGLPFRCAVFVVGTVISRSAGRVVVDAGWRAIGCNYGPPIPLDSGAQVHAMADEHTTLTWSGALPELGSKVCLRPTQNRTTFSLYRTVLLVRKCSVVQEVPVAPGGVW